MAIKGVGLNQLEPGALPEGEYLLKVETLGTGATVFTAEAYVPASSAQRVTLTNMNETRPEAVWAGSEWVTVEVAP